MAHRKNHRNRHPQSNLSNNRPAPVKSLQAAKVATPQPVTPKEPPADDHSVRAKFQIFIGQPNPENAVYDVAWCLNRQAMEGLMLGAVKHPFMLVSVFREGDSFLSDEVRELAPLEVGLAQVQVHRAGIFQFAASIVWASEEADKESSYRARKELAKKYLARASSNRYSLDLTNRGEYFPSNLGQETLSHHEIKRIQVGDELFAKKPPGIFWWLGNLWHEAPPRDQCQFRRRLIATALVKIWFVLLWGLIQVVSRTVSGLFLHLVVGRRDVKYGVIVHPFSLNFKEILPSPEGGEINFKKLWWATDRRGKERPGLISFLMSPFCWVVITLIWTIVLSNSTRMPLEDILDWALKCLGYAGIIYACICVAVLIVALGFVLVENIRSKRITGQTERERRKHLAEESVAKQQAMARRRQEEAEQRAHEQFYEVQIGPLTCDTGGPRAGSVKALPKSHQTAILRFKDFKAQVCRPFQRGV